MEDLQPNESLGPSRTSCGYRHDWCKAHTCMFCTTQSLFQFGLRPCRLNTRAPRPRTVSGPSEDPPLRLAAIAPVYDTADIADRSGHSPTSVQADRCTWHSNCAGTVTIADRSPFHNKRRRLMSWKATPFINWNGESTELSRSFS